MAAIIWLNFPYPVHPPVTEMNQRRSLWLNEIDEHSTETMAMDKTTTNYAGCDSSAKIRIRNFDQFLHQMELLFDETHRRIDAALSSCVEKVGMPPNELTIEDVDGKMIDPSMDAVSTTTYTEDGTNNNDLEANAIDNAVHLAPRVNTSWIKMSSLALFRRVPSDQITWSSRVLPRRFGATASSCLHQGSKRAINIETGTFRGLYYVDVNTGCVLFLRKRRDLEPVFSFIMWILFTLPKRFSSSYLSMFPCILS